MAELVDVESRESPSFQIPARAERETLRPGMFVKVILTDRERVWLIVLSRRENWTGVISREVSYVGVLDNEPVIVEGLHHGDLVPFAPQHVCDIADATTDSRNIAERRTMAGT